MIFLSKFDIMDIVKTYEAGDNMQPYKEFSELLPKLMTMMGPQIYDEFGVTAQQFSYLRDIGNGPISVGELSSKRNAKLPAVTRLIRRLEEKGWVARKQDDIDRRVVWLELTKQGRAFMEKLARKREKVFDKMFSKINHEDQIKIVAGFRMLLNSLNE